MQTYIFHLFCLYSEWKKYFIQGLVCIMRKSKIFMLMVFSGAIILSSVPAGNIQKADAAGNYIFNAKIPYHDFYAAYGTDTVKGVTDNEYLDAVTSATVNKAKMNETGGLCAGTYYSEEADGSKAYINGVVFPVIVNEETKLALIKNGTYSEADFSEAVTGSYPPNYLNARIEDGKMVYTVAETKDIKITDVKAELNTNTRYGDYQISLSGSGIDANIATGVSVVYGVIVNTAEKNSYPMYTLENIWRNTQLAWSAGFVTETHGCPLRPDIYKSMMGETITDIKYITNKGNYNIDIEDIYIPKKTTNSITADSVSASDTTEITVKLQDMPVSFKPEVTISGCEAKITQLSSESATNGTVNYVYSITADKIVPDTYTITASDTSKEYADIVSTVDVKGANVTFDGTKLVLNAPASGDSIANYLNKISKTEVTKPDGETVSYLPKLGRGSAIIANLFDENGVLDLSAKYESIKVTGGHGNSKSEVTSSGEVFENEGTYTVSVTTSVYDTVTFNIKKGGQQEPGNSDNNDNGNQQATVSKPAKVLIKSAKNSAKKTVTVKWEKAEDADGYEIRYVTGSQIKVVNAKNTSVSVKIKKLVKGKTYKINVRAYKTADGKNYNGSWSKTLKVKIKR